MNAIETERLILRPFTLADAGAHQRVVYGDPDVTPYLPTGKPWPLEETTEVIAWWIEHQDRHGFGPWAVAKKATGEHVGHCGLMLIPRSDDGSVEVLYAFGKAWWGRGYATEAARASLRYGFERAGLERIVALAVSENVGSQRVMQKIGMRYEATDDRYYDFVLARYALSRGEFRDDGSPFVVR